MHNWYDLYYLAAPASAAYSAFCTRVYGRNYAQHGFADMAQVDALLATAQLGPANRVLELGCGSGGVAAYIAETSGAHITGLDLCPEAIRQAQLYTPANPARLVFQVADIAAIPFSAATFDTVVDFDALYFTEPIQTIAGLKAVLMPGGQLLSFYSHGANPQMPLPVFRCDTLRPDRTPLALALQANGFHFETWDFTEADRRHAQHKQRVLEELKPVFEAEGNRFLFDSRYGEALGVQAALDANAHVRYLYRAWLPQP